MKLTTEYLKKLIKEEMQKLPLNEAAFDWMLMAYIVHLQGVINKRKSQEQTYDVVAHTNRSEKTKSFLIAILLLRAFAKIAGAMGGMMQEEYMQDTFQMPQEMQLVQAYRELTPDEIMQTVQMLEDNGVMGANPQDAMSVSDQELMSIMDEFDPIGFYYKNK